jgi:hypothetical protein
MQSISVLNTEQHNKLLYHGQTPNLLAMFVVVVCGFRDYSLAYEKSREIGMSVTVFPPINSDD